MVSQNVKTVEGSARIRGYDTHTCVKRCTRPLLVDTLGLPIASYVTPADVHDAVVARKLLAGLAPLVPRRKRDLGGCYLAWEGAGRLVQAPGCRLGPGGG
jgi:hypothetical protein